MSTRPGPSAAALRRAPPAWSAALAGALAGAAAIAASELVAGLTGAPSLVTAIGTLVISLQPPGAKDLVVSLFGTSDKLALGVAVVVVGVGIAAIAGVAAARRPAVGSSVFIVFGILAAVAAAQSPLVSSVFAVVNAALAIGVGLVTLRALLRRAGFGASAPVGPAPASEPVDPALDWPRRRFLIASAGTLGGVIVAGGLGRALVEGGSADAVVASTKLPSPAVRAAALGADQVLDAPGLTPLVVPNDEFYRIDTALVVPRVKVDGWELAVTGMVDRELTFTYDDLLAMPLHEQYVTIACVSNRVGDHLVGNALWTGVRLKDVLESAGVRAGATQIVGRAVDGFTVGFPTDWAMSPEREPMIVVGMNREPLPAAHGFPARLIIPGLYGYVSATKWLKEIELTTRDGFDGYWVPLGWAKDAPILTQSRIDVPTDGRGVDAGPIRIAGVAWAPDRGVAAVEVRVDDGDWQRAQISRPISDATWVQWALPWTAPAGRHTVEVRAIDGTGAVQTDESSPPAPDGARGHHRISFVAG